MLTRSSVADWRRAGPSVSMKICNPGRCAIRTRQIPMLRLGFAEMNYTDAVRLSMAPSACTLEQSGTA